MVISIQIIDKSSGRYKVVKSVGSSKDLAELENLVQQARQQLDELMGQQVLDFEVEKEREILDLFLIGFLR